MVPTSPELSPRCWACEANICSTLTASADVIQCEAVSLTDSSALQWAGALTSLSYMLSLNLNSLSGSLATQLGQLTQLRTLAVATNQLSGMLPTCGTPLFLARFFRMQLLLTRRAAA